MKKFNHHPESAGCYKKRGNIAASNKPRTPFLKKYLRLTTLVYHVT